MAASEIEYSIAVQRAVTGYGEERPELVISDVVRELVAGNADSFAVHLSDRRATGSSNEDEHGNVTGNA